MKIVATEEKYSALVGDQASEVVTCIVDDRKEASNDEYVKEVNSYKSWDVVFEMNLTDDNGLHENLVSNVWYAKEDWYGVVGFITGVINSIG